MKRLRPLLGTYVGIEVEGLDAGHAAPAIDAAFAAVELVHRLMSVHRPDSDISRLNRDAWRHPVEVHPWTLRTLRWALSIHAATDGLFDCAVGYELNGAGLLADCGLEHVVRGSLADVELLPDGRCRFARRLGLDFGGIAKGFAVDRAIATLRRHGVRSAVVDAGGDMRMIGAEPRPIHVRDPADARRYHFAGRLANGAIATSTAAAGALLCARDRTPLRSASAYSVLAPVCVAADALTKVVAQTGQPDAPALARFGATALITAPCARAA
jgi:thiamine biosynthesis lipoprotein